MFKHSWLGAHRAKGPIESKIPSTCSLQVKKCAKMMYLIHPHTNSPPSKHEPFKRNAPIKDGGSNNVGMGLGPGGVLEKIAGGTLLLEVFVGYRAGEAGLAVVLVGLDAAHAADCTQAGGVAAGRSGQLADGGSGGKHGSGVRFR